MTRQAGRRTDRDYLLQGSPTNTTFRETFSRELITSDCAIAATGVAYCTRIPMDYGDIIGNVTFIIGGTAAGTPTAGYVAVRDAAGAVVAQSADLSTTARAANTAYTVPMASSYLVESPGLYYVEISFTATTVPTIAGRVFEDAAQAGAADLSLPILAQSHGSAVAATPPATIATPTTVVSRIWAAITE
jgi:hypothetical protein